MRERMRSVHLAAVHTPHCCHPSYSRQYSTDAETFTTQIQEQLSHRLGRPIDVVNAGVTSYGPDQVSLKMEDELPWLEPDLVIVAIYAGNDYG